MNKMFTQPSGPVAKQTNKQALARIWGYSESTIKYLQAGSTITGSSLLIDRATGTVWFAGTANGDVVSWVVGLKSLSITTSTGSYVCWPAISSSCEITNAGQAIRGMGDKLKDIPCILDWDTDSSQDDSLRIKRAIADGIKYLYVPSTKVFNIGEVDITTNMLIYGNGVAGYRQVGGLFRVNDDAEYGFNCVGTGDGTTEGIRVIGGGFNGISIIGATTACKADLIRGIHASSQEIRNVGFRQTQGSAIALSDFMESRIEACYFNSIGADDKHPIHIKDFVGSAPWNVNNLHIRENTFGSCSGNWIHMSDKANADLIWIHGNKFEWDSTPTAANTSPKAVIYAGRVERVSIKDNGFVYFYPAHNNYASILEVGANAAFGVTFSDNMAWGCNNANYWDVKGGSLSGSNNRSNASMTTSVTSTHSQDIDYPIIRTSVGNKPTSYAAKRHDTEFISAHAMTGSNASNVFTVDADAVMYGTCMNTLANAEIRRAFVPKDMLASGRCLKITVRCKNTNTDPGQLQLLLNGNAVTDSISSQSSNLNYIAIPGSSDWKEYVWYLSASQLASRGALIFRNNSSVRFLFDGIKIEYASMQPISVPWSTGSIPANTIANTTLSMGGRLAQHIKGVSGMSANGSLGGAFSSAYFRASDNTLVFQLLAGASAATVTATSLTVMLLLE